MNDADVKSHARKGRLHPLPVRIMHWVNALSVIIMIMSGWKLEEGKLNLDVEIPANTTAIVFVPTTDPSTVREGGMLAGSSPGVKHVRDEKGCAVFEVGSGKYEFESPWK